MNIGLVVSLFLAPIAAMMAFIITYEEYKRHFFDKKKPFKHALEAAMFTLIFFLFLGFVIGIVLSKMFK